MLKPAGWLDRRIRNPAGRRTVEQRGKSRGWEDIYIIYAILNISIIHTYIKKIIYIYIYKKMYTYKKYI